MPTPSLKGVYLARKPKGTQRTMVISEVSRTYGILALESPFLLARTRLNTISTGRLMMGI